jgi:hypothetical protein
LAEIGGDPAVPEKVKPTQQLGSSATAREVLDVEKGGFVCTITCVRPLRRKFVAVSDQGVRLKVIPDRSV